MDSGPWDRGWSVRMSHGASQYVHGTDDRQDHGGWIVAHGTEVEV
jgi:hypothetical protein